MNKESKNIQIQPEWQALKEKAEQCALQCMNNPDLDKYAKTYIIGFLSENTRRTYAFDTKIFRL